MTTPTGSSIATRDSALRTDLYELTMACAYWRAGRHDHEAAFHLFYRSNPFGGPAVACGLGPAAEYVERFSFTDEELRYLATLESGGEALFPAEFLEYLRGL